jgi:hypothetical protein
MIVVLPELHGSPRVLELDRCQVIELARAIEDGTEVSAADTELKEFAPAWARLRCVIRQAKHFANLAAALHFYRFGNHGLHAVEAARIVRRIRAAQVAPVDAPP